MNLDATLMHRIAAIACCLTAHGIDAVEASYSGCGDDGSMCDLSAADAEDRDLDSITLPPDDAAAWERPPVSLADAIEEVAEELIDACGHSGYENDEGGHGVVTIRAQGQWHLDHNDAYVEHEHSEYGGTAVDATVCEIA